MNYTVGDPLKFVRAIKLARGLIPFLSGSRQPRTLSSPLSDDGAQSVQSGYLANITPAYVMYNNSVSPSPVESPGGILCRHYILPRPALCPHTRQPDRTDNRVLDYYSALTTATRLSYRYTPSQPRQTPLNFRVLRRSRASLLRSSAAALDSGATVGAYRMTASRLE